MKPRRPRHDASPPWSARRVRERLATEALFPAAVIVRRDLSLARRAYPAVPRLAGVG